METKLMELTNKIYKEGVLKAEAQAKDIIANAEAEAEKIIKKAKEEANQLVEKAKSEADQIKNKTLSELRMAQSQAISLLKQNIIDIIAGIALKDELKKAVSDVDFIKELIVKIVSKWEMENKSLDIELIMPEKMKKEFDDYIKKQITDSLKKGVEVKFENRMKNGFKIGPKDGSFVVSFSEEDVESFFYSFLKAKTKDILFPKG